MNQDKDDSLQYWAILDTRTCADEVMRRVSDYYDFSMTKGKFREWANLYYAYDPNNGTGGDTQLIGESGEYRSIKVNQFKSLLDNVKQLTITDRPAWEPQASNSDAKSLKQTDIARGILDYLMHEKRVESYLSDALQYAIIFGEGFVMEQWDPSLGEALAFDETTGQTRTQGDIVYHSMQPVDVIRDPNLQSYNQRSWLVVRTYECKFNLAEKYPEYRQEIVGQQHQLTSKDHYLVGNTSNSSTVSDEIPVLNFFHSKTAACPQGRQMVLLPDGTVLMDIQKLMYDHIPVHRISAGNRMCTPFGRSVSLDLLPLQYVLNCHWTAILSINEAFGIPKMLIPTTANVDITALEPGFRVVEYNASGGKPEMMTMPTAPAGYYQAIQAVVQEMQAISGVNSVSRGQPEASLKSGSALALVQSMAIQFHEGLQQSYVELMEEVGSNTLSIMKEYADSPRVIEIVGTRKKGMVQQSFTGKDIDKITRVQVQVGNPLSKTTAGKLSMAESLMQNHIITADEYMQIIETGSLESALQGTESDLLGLAQENDDLTNGLQVMALVTDNHKLHINEHKSIASDPEVRRNPQLLNALNAHLQEHISMMMNPANQPLFQALGEQGLQPPQQGQPQGQPGASGGQPQAPQGMPPGMPPMGTGNAPQGPGAPMSNAQIQQMASKVHQPNMPKIAGTKVPFSPTNAQAVNTAFKPQ